MRTWHKKGIGPRNRCSHCDKVLRFDNTSGLCVAHSYLISDAPSRRRPFGPIDQCHHCGKPLRLDNSIGYCHKHRHFSEREKIRTTNRWKNHAARNSALRTMVMIGRACEVAGCERFRVIGYPLCAEHTETWRTSIQRDVAVKAALRFMDTAMAPTATPVKYSPAALSKLADALLGTDFGKLPSTDAMFRATSVEDSPSIARRVGFGRQRDR